MNYLKEILTFENWLDYNSEINKSDIRLWYTLMFTANRFNWKEFSIPISALMFKSKLSKNDVYRSRNKLKQMGLIDFKERSGNQCAIYKINSFISVFETQADTQNDIGINTVSDAGNNTSSTTGYATTLNTSLNANVGNINKTRNININKKEIYKEKFGEFGNVFLSNEEFEKLKSKLGAETESYIERLSSYIASSGKRYKSHYATILSWTQKDAKNSGGVSYGINPKKLCTEYPE
jgi:hypothetical protein